MPDNKTAADNAQPDARDILLPPAFPVMDIADEYA
jgi:hypothetical protein